MLKELQKMLSTKEQEVKALKLIIADLQKEQSKGKLPSPNYKYGVNIRYDLPSNSIYVTVHDSKEKVYICYLDTPKNVVDKIIDKYPKTKYAINVMEADFKTNLSQHYYTKLLEEVRLRKKK